MSRPCGRPLRMPGFRLRSLLEVRADAEMRVDKLYRHQQIGHRRKVTGYLVRVVDFRPEGRMPPCSVWSGASRCRAWLTVPMLLQPCLTGPARGGLPLGRAGRRDVRPSIGHWDGSRGKAFRPEMAVPVVERDEMVQLLHSRVSVVAGDEIAESRFDFCGGAEDLAPDRLLLQLAQG